MKKNLCYLLIGCIIATAGSIVAATTLPFHFTAGQKAKASEVNANFDALASAVNGLDERASALEQSSGTDSPEIITVSQVDLPAGSQITVGGVSYTIVQFEVPRFDTDEVYVLKYPSNNDFSVGSSNEYLSVVGSYSTDSHYSSALVTSLNGFAALVAENYGYTGLLSVSDSGRDFRASFNQGLDVTILLGPQTRVGIYNIGNPIFSLDGSSSTRSADATGMIPVYPPAITASEREINRQNLRTLLSYVIITKKV